MGDATRQYVSPEECCPKHENDLVGLQLPRPSVGEGLELSDKDGNTALSSLACLRLEGVSRSPLLKKLLHFRDSFEPPLLSLFGVPFVLRHQLSASPCCPCCSRCCCCGVFSLKQFQEEVEGAVPRDATSGRARLDSVPIYRPCAASACRCCKEISGVAGVSRVLFSNIEGVSQDGSGSAGAGDSRPIPARIVADAAAFTRPKRRRLVGDGDREGGILEHIVTQDEREVEILLAQNVLRQVRLPIASGNLVLFFTEDWLALLRRCVRTAQRHALTLHENPDRSRRGDEDMQAGHPAAVLCASRGGAARGGRPGNSLESRGLPCQSDEYSDASAPRAESSGTTRSRQTSKDKAKQERESRFSESQRPGGGVASRREALLDWPVLLGEQLAHVLQTKVLSVQTHTELKSSGLLAVLRDYLLSWRRRRRDTGILLRETLRKAKELRRRRSEAWPAGAEGRASAEKGTQPSRSEARHRAGESEKESETFQALQRVWNILERGIVAGEEVLTLREAAGFGVFSAPADGFSGAVEALRTKKEDSNPDRGTPREASSSLRMVCPDSTRREDAQEARAYRLVRLLLGDLSSGDEASCSDGKTPGNATCTQPGSDADQTNKAAPARPGLTRARDGRRLNSEAEEILLLLHELNLARSIPDASAVSLCIAQQGLLVRWLLDGRKEVLGRLRARKFKELLWVDVERQGLLRTGLGSRMTLLDLQGKGDVEAVPIGGGLVVRLRGELRRGMRVFSTGG